MHVGVGEQGAVMSPLSPLHGICCVLLLESLKLFDARQDVAGLCLVGVALLHSGLHGVLVGRHGLHRVQRGLKQRLVAHEGLLLAVLVQVVDVLEVADHVGPGLHCHALHRQGQL